MIDVREMNQITQPVEKLLADEFVGQEQIK